MTDDTLPTFASNRDRLVWLVGEYKWPLSVIFLSLCVILAWVSPQIPTPPGWLLGFAVAAAFVALPTYVVGLRIARWLWSPDWIWVGIADPGTVGETDSFETETYDGKRVSPQLWDNKTVVGYPPGRPDGGCFDFVVTRWEYHEDVEDLEVRGVDGADLSPAEAWESSNKVDEIYDHHHRVRRLYSQLKSTVQKMATEIHDATLMIELSEQEKAQLSGDVSVTDLIDDMESDVEDLPDAPATDEPPQHVRVLNEDGEGDFDIPGAGSLEDPPADGPAAADGGPS